MEYYEIAVDAQRQLEKLRAENEYLWSVLTQMDTYMEYLEWSSNSTDDQHRPPVYRSNHV